MYYYSRHFSSTSISVSHTHLFTCCRSHVMACYYCLLRQGAHPDIERELESAMDPNSFYTSQECVVCFLSSPTSALDLYPFIVIVPVVLYCFSKSGYHLKNIRNSNFYKKVPIVPQKFKITLKTFQRNEFMLPISYFKRFLMWFCFTFLFVYSTPNIKKIIIMGTGTKI